MENYYLRPCPLHNSVYFANTRLFLATRCDPHIMKQKFYQLHFQAPFFNANVTFFARRLTALFFLSSSIGLGYLRLLIIVAFTVISAISIHGTHTHIAFANCRLCIHDFITRDIAHLKLKIVILQ